DTNNGLNQATAFGTIQRGVDALCPGDTLTIGPGEYFGAVCRTNIGAPNAETLIRAELPGTVILRGDVPLPPFRKVEGQRFAYAAELDGKTPALAVNELNTLSRFRRLPNLAELEFQMGGMFHDLEKNTIYISTADMTPPTNRTYTAMIVGKAGIELNKARRVRLDGLAVTGFKGRAILVLHSSGCIVSNCRAYLNGGIGMNIYSESRRGDQIGSNAIERCASWANDGHGFSIYMAQYDTLRDSTAFLNTGIGLSIYHGMSRQEGNLSWGNIHKDYQLKQGGRECVHEAERTAVAGEWNHETHNDLARHCLVGWIRQGSVSNHFFKDCIVLGAGKINPDFEFADPLNRDYRLQASSLFRGAAADGTDAGPFPYQANIYFVSTNGNDKSDGLSVSNAWNTFAHATRALKAGDTLYILAGRYGEDMKLKAGKVKASPILIRGRGTGLVELAGNVQIDNCHNLSFERLHLTGNVAVSGGNELAFEQCAFACPGGFAARDLDGLRLVHNEFSGGGKAQVNLAGCKNAFLAGNLFENAGGEAISADKPESFLFADYNCYRQPAAAWRLEGKTLALGKLPGGMERYGTALKAGEKAAAGTGLYGRPAGNCRLALTDKILKAAGPYVHSAGASSADIEWFVSHESKVEVAWGETPDCTNSRTIDSKQYRSFSLADLKPSTRYYTRIRTLKPAPAAPGEPEINFAGVAWNSEPVPFDTLARDPDPVTYYVATNGADANPGTSPAKPLRTLYRAADIVRTGDKVLIAGGVYYERIYARATGTRERPVTFAALPGERVWLDGKGELDNLIVAFNKSHLRFDGLFLRGIASRLGSIVLSGGEDIRLTRLFFDGRGGLIFAGLLDASAVSKLVLRNCVSASGSGPCIKACPDFLMEHCLILQNIIGGTQIEYVRADNSLIRNTIITDCQPNKLIVPVDPIPRSLLEHDKLLENLGYYLRPERRAHGTRHFGGGGGYSGDEFEELVLREGHLLGDPMFEMLYREGAQPTEGFAAEKLCEVGGNGQPTKDLTFRDLFATNPEFVRRKIGLNPEDFKDFYPGR
ncbi:MAG: right-handed parallel beta-helix repeat-containing protein, partial [Kiritimatiellia bacterium]